MENFNEQAPVRPENNLGKAITAMVLCWPFGVPALVNATRVNVLYDSGKYAEAQNASNQAAKWGKIGMIVGIVNIAFLIVFYTIYFSAIIGLSIAGEL